VDRARAGDVVVALDGTYTGPVVLRVPGTAQAPITLRASTPYQAVLMGDQVCDRSHEGLTVQQPYWTIQGFTFRGHGRAVGIFASFVTFERNMIAHFREEGVRVDGVVQGRVQGTVLRENVIANGDTCPGTDSPGVYLVRNVDQSTVVNNVIMATGDNGYTCGGGGGCTVGQKFGYGLLIANNSDDNLVQGNLLLGNGGKGVFRILSNGVHSTTSNRNMVRDNAFLFGEGAGAVSDDCNDDANQFVNNIAYGNYFWNWYTKGNLPGTTGHHVVAHNLFYATAFTRGNVGFLVTDAACSSPSGIGYKLANTLRDNVFYADGALTGSVDTRILLTLQGPQAAILTTLAPNLFWAPTGRPTWTSGYTFHGTDLATPTAPPQFVNPTQGDFTLVPGSPGTRAASDGSDLGITYNAFLKKAWLQRAFALPTLQRDDLTTSVAVSVSPQHWYQVWFYIPSVAYQGVETFQVEGQTLPRDIRTLTQDPTWTQPGGPARWITLGRHRAADGTLNIAWSQPGSASKLFLRQLPTPEEAVMWLGAVSPVPPDPTLAPRNLRIVPLP
jgi:hypothetical protein